MESSPESRSQASIGSRKKRAGTLIMGLLILMSLISIPIFKITVESRPLPSIVMRVDDIQDFAFREAQLFLINESISNQVPFSLAIIAGRFGDDAEIVPSVKLAVSQGTEVTAHGWEHEDLAELSLEKQSALLSQSRSRLKEILGYEVDVLVPPMFSFNQDTLRAMHQQGYKIISANIDVKVSGLVSNVVSLPATVKLSVFLNGIWRMRNSDSVRADISASIKKYGFAVIVTHPQEFVSDGKLNPVAVESYRVLLKYLKKHYSFKTLQELGESYEAQ